MNGRLEIETCSLIYFTLIFTLLFLEFSFFHKCHIFHFTFSSVVPPNIADLKNLEVLNVFNNQIEELPTQISSLQKLKHLNLG